MPSGAQMMQEMPNNVAKLAGSNQVASRVGEIEHPRRAAEAGPFPGGAEARSCCGALGPMGRCIHQSHSQAGF